MDIISEAHKILKENRRTTEGHQYTLPSPSTYPYQWLWDSCFHAIVLAKLEVDAAKAELRSLIFKQLENGMIPHIIYWQPGSLYNYEWGKQGVSAITEPPMLAYAVWEIYKQDNDTNFLKEMFPAIFKFMKYLVEERDLHNNHLIGLINPEESGEDNSPRFDSLLGASPEISWDEHLQKRLALVEQNKTCNFDAETCMRKYFWVKDVPFHAIMIENLRCLGHIASRLEEADAEHFSKTQIDLISKAMRKELMEDGVYWSVLERDDKYHRVKVATWAHFAPLFADLYTPAEAKEVVEKHLLNEDTFLSQFGICTVSKKEPSYNTNGWENHPNWRGPVWMAPHWFIYRGLVKYGFDKEAEMIRGKSRLLLEKEGFREYYDPETGKGLGAENFTWGALVVDMINK